MAEPKRCPQCRAELPADAPEGICPKCLLEAGLGESASRRDATTQALVVRDAEPGPHEPPGTRVRYFGDYELIEEIGRGGMGVIYKARQVSLNRVVAVKMILAGQLASEADVRRFHAEAEAAAGLQHPHIVAIHEVGEHQGQHYFSMDYVEGRSLADMVRESPLPERQAAGYVKTVAEAIHYAHQKGIIHRDLKPSNVLVDRAGQPRITDFGLAKQVADERGLTLSGSVLGTPSYMPPEQADRRRGEVGPWSDVYSLGAVLYELLTGRPPFRAETALETLAQALHAEPAAPRLVNPGLPRDIETVCLKCLAKEPGRRYASAQELADDLGRHLAGEPIHARPTSAWERAAKWARRRPAIAALSAAIVLLAVLGFALVTWQWRQAEAARADAAGKARSESAARQKAEQATLAEAEARRKAVEAASSEADAKRKAEAARSAEATARSAAEAERDGKGKALVRADGLRLTAWSSAVRPANPGLALLLAIEGAQRAPGLLANNALREAYEDCHEERVLRGHKFPVQFATFSPDGERVLTYDRPPDSYSYADARIWDAATGKELAVLVGHHLPIASASFSPDGQRVVLTYGHGAGGHYMMYEALRYQSGAARVYTDRVARLWDAATGKELVVLRGHKSKVVSAVFSPDGKRLVTASLDGTARVWDVATGKEVAATEATECCLRGAIFSSDGLRVLTATSEWRPESHDAYRHGESGPKTVEDPPAGILPPGIDPADRRTGGGSAGNGSGGYRDDPEPIRIYDAATGKKLGSIKKVVPAFRLGYNIGQDRIRCLALSPDGQRAFTAVHQATIWDTATGKPLVTLPESILAGVYYGTFSPDGRRLLITAGKMAIWDAETGSELVALAQSQEPGQSPGRASFSPDGRAVVAPCEDKAARVWEAQTGKELAVLKGHDLAVTSVALSPDGTRAVTASADGTARLWNLARSRELASRLCGHRGKVKIVAYSPDGGRLASGSEDGSARIWDAATGKELRVLRGLESLGNLPARDNILGPVRFLQFSGDGRRLLTLSEGPIAEIRRRSGWLRRTETSEKVPYTPVRIWDVETGKETVTLSGHESAVERAELSADGTRAVTAETGHERTGSFTDSYDRQMGSGGGNTKAGRLLRIWDAVSGKELLPAKSQAFACLSPDGRRALITEKDQPQPPGGQRAVAARIWDIASGKPIADLEGPTTSVSFAKFSPDGQRVLTDWRNARPRIWDAATGKLLLTFKGPPSWLAVAAFTPDGRRVVVSNGWTAHVLDAATGDPLCAVNVPNHALWSPALSRDGRLLVTASADQAVRLWDAATGQELFTLPVRPDEVAWADISPDGRHVAAACSDLTVRIWPVDPLPAALARKPRELTDEERQRFEIGAPKGR